MTAKRPDRPAGHALDHPDEAGAYIGRRPERAADTIPGGVRPEDERIAANSTLGSLPGRPDEHDRAAQDSAGDVEESGRPGEPG